jgi:hypothetical protein
MLQTLHVFHETLALIGCKIRLIVLAVYQQKMNGILSPPVPAITGCASGLSAIARSIAACSSAFNNRLALLS